jgi:hypothetical protein
MKIGKLAKTFLKFTCFDKTRKLKTSGYALLRKLKI